MLTIPHSKANQANLSQLQLAWKQLSTLNKLSMTFLCKPILYFQVFCIGLLIQGFFLMVLSVYWKLYSSSWPISSCVVISWNTHWMLLFWIASIGATLPVCNEVGKWMSEEFDEKFSTRFYIWTVRFSSSPSLRSKRYYFVFNSPGSRETFS